MVQPQATQLWSAASKDSFDARSAWLDRDYDKAEQLLRGADTKMRTLNDLLPVPPPPSYPWGLIAGVVVAAAVVTLVVMLISRRPDRDRQRRLVMAGEQGHGDATPDRFHHEALLKEYEMCQQEATSTANWIWASTSVFLASWLVLLSAVVANMVTVKSYVWYLTVIAIVAQLAWFAYLARSLRMRQIIFVRQRQIEQRLGLLKSIAITSYDDGKLKAKYIERLKGTPYAKELEEFLDTARDEMPRGWLEAKVAYLLSWPLKIIGLGQTGRAALYVLSFLVAVAWILIALHS